MKRNGESESQESERKMNDMYSVRSGGKKQTQKRGLKFEKQDRAWEREGRSARGRKGKKEEKIPWAASHPCTRHL